MQKESKYFYIDTTIGNVESIRLAELNAFTTIEKIIKNIDIRKPDFQEIADYISSFDSAEDKKYIINEIRIQFVHKMDCDFEEIQPFLPNIFGHSFAAVKVLEKRNWLDMRQVKIYSHNDDTEIHVRVMPLHLFLSEIVELFIDYMVIYNPHYSKKISESKIQGLENDILLETYTFLSDKLKMSNIDIEDLIYYGKTSSKRLKILKHYSSYLTVRHNPHSNKNYYETLVELFIFYFVHNEILHADLKENNNYFKNISLQKLPNFLKYVKKNQILSYTINYFAKRNKIDPEILKKIWKVVFKPYRGSVIDTSKMHIIPEPLIDIDNYIPGKKLMKISLYDYLQ